MFCQFSVKNYKSFKNTATLDMQATNIDSHDSSVLIDHDGSKFLPLAVIYGPNGGGKSNILDAFYCLCVHILRPVCAACDAEECKEKIIPPHPAIPFKFDKESYKNPTEFELFFRINQNEYKYNLHLIEEKVVHESLSRIKVGGSRITKIFIRDVHLKNYFLSTAFNSINIDNVTDSLPWLSYFAITNRKIPIIKDVITWFHKLDFLNYGQLILEKKLLILKGKHKELELQMLKEMDIDIEDYRFEKERIAERKSRFITIHINNGDKFELELEDESSGTIKLLNVIPYISRALLNGSTLIVDELDAKLHPKLLLYIINLFKRNDINKNNAQLIFTSHDIATMTPDVFRRDEIWFAAKNSEQSSCLYSLVEIKKENGKKPRNDEKYGKRYLEGKYGADPYLKRLLNWEKFSNEYETGQGLEKTKSN